MPNNAPAQYPFKRQLHKGMRGRDVEVMQMWIDEINSFYQFCVCEELPITGYFGDRTQYFIRAFQSFADIKTTGVYDYKTREFLNARYNSYIAGLDEANKKPGSGIWNN